MREKTTVADTPPAARSPTATSSSGPCLLCAPGSSLGAATEREPPPGLELEAEAEREGVGRRGAPLESELAAWAPPVWRKRAREGWRRSPLVGSLLRTPGSRELGLGAGAHQGRGGARPVRPPPPTSSRRQGGGVAGRSSSPPQGPEAGVAPLHRRGSRSSSGPASETRLGVRFRRREQGREGGAAGS
jgi:hypothetical protein